MVFSKDSAVQRLKDFKKHTRCLSLGHGVLLLKRLPGGHVSILYFGNKVGEKQQQQGKQWQPEVIRGCLEGDRVGGDGLRRADEPQVV